MKKSSLLAPLDLPLTAVSAAGAVACPRLDDQLTSGVAREQPEMEDQLEATARLIGRGFCIA